MNRLKTTTAPSLLQITTIEMQHPRHTRNQEDLKIRAHWLTIISTSAPAHSSHKHKLMAPPLTLLSPHHSSWKLLLVRLNLKYFQMVSLQQHITSPPWSIRLIFEVWQWCPSDLFSSRSLMWHAETWNASKSIVWGAAEYSSLRDHLQKIKSQILYTNEVMWLEWSISPNPQVFGFWFRPHEF